MRETLKSLGALDHSTLAAQAIRQHKQIDAVLKGLGGVESIREHMARTAEAQRAFSPLPASRPLQMLWNGQRTVRARGSF